MNLWMFALLEVYVLGSVGLALIVWWKERGEHGGPVNALVFGALWPVLLIGLAVEGVVRMIRDEGHR